MWEKVQIQLLVTGTITLKTTGWEKRTLTFMQTIARDKTKTTLSYGKLLGE